MHKPYPDPRSNRGVVDIVTTTATTITTTTITTPSLANFNPPARAPTPLAYTRAPTPLAYTLTHSPELPNHIPIDLEQQLPLLERNVEANGVGESVECVALPWGEVGQKNSVEAEEFQLILVTHPQPQPRPHNPTS